MKVKHVYVCQSCGHQESKWLGRCPGCMAWSSLVEEVVSPHTKKHLSSQPASQAIALSNITYTEDSPRLSTGIASFDHVLGGGLVHGSLVLVGGDPGIVKSTLLLQTLGSLVCQVKKALYVSAEESVKQIKMRADRLHIEAPNLFLLCATHFQHVEEALKQIKPDVLVIDSVQTVGIEGIESTFGSVAQIRALTQKLMEVSKQDGIATFVIGHVTKEGAIAGPKVMEHMVDTVLYFEGERTGPYRILRAHKNRFGSAQEIGVFEMVSEGLRGVSNPSELFLAQRSHAPGSTVVTSLEGSRPLLLEVQALTTQAQYGNARRTSIGFDTQRVHMLCAVLAARGNMDLSMSDVYVNIAGGVRVTETAADLGVAMALASSYTHKMLPQDTVMMGEVGLSGEIRSISQLPTRIQEASALGFKRAYVPQVDLERYQGAYEIPLIGVGHVREALDMIHG
jgi:DNA repair protein RadA/Sms